MVGQPRGSPTRRAPAFSGILELGVQRARRPMLKPETDDDRTHGPIDLLILELPPDTAGHDLGWLHLLGGLFAVVSLAVIWAPLVQT
jgi:hypothetical protein